MQNPDGLLYTQSHEWVKVENDILTIGITAHAQDALGDIVFLELPAVGKAVKKNQPCCVVESVKAASDIYSPADGEIIEVNQQLANTPHQINEDPYNSWIFKLKINSNNPVENLLKADQYLSSIGE